MKKRIFKISVILAIILTMTMSNFVLVGSGLISYAQEQITTNNQNVEFRAYFKSEQGNEVQSLERKITDEENFLYLQVDVKKEGYFNGKITLKDGNFKLKTSDSSFVNKIENNTISLNQINVGTTEEIKVEIEPMEDKKIDIGLLNKVSNIEIEGIYRDSKQRDIKIKAQRELSLNLAENNTATETVNQLDIISNKFVTIQGEEKRMVQFSYKMGLAQNNYPIKEIDSKITLPKNEGKEVQIEKVAYLNDMKSIDYDIKQNEINLVLKNEPDGENKVNWEIQGNENVVITCIYDKDAQVENTNIIAQETIILYNDKKIETQGEITIDEEQLDNTIEVEAVNSKEEIYKGKINAGIEKQIQSTTTLKVNYAKTINNIDIVENESNYAAEEVQMPANVTYKRTTINKTQFDEIFGQNGSVTIYDQNGSVVGIVNSTSVTDEKGNIVIDYNGSDIRKLTIKTTQPEKEGKIEFVHKKAIKEGAAIDEQISELKNTVTANYNEIEGAKEIEQSIHLENSNTKVELITDKDSLSTVISNNVEMKIVLRTNNEKYELFKNPEITLQLPEQVENVTINDINLLYDEELSIRDYQVEGRTIHINLDGEQTNYKEKVIEGATIIVNAIIDVNRKVATKDEIINLTYTNQKGKSGEVQIPTKIEAPTELTAIQSIHKLGIETIGQEENKEIMMQKAIGEQNLETDLEIINNKEEDMQNIKILGEFPTDHGDNNMGIKLTKGIELQNIEEATIYYTANEQATEDLESIENGWTEDLNSVENVSKYLILTDKVEGQSSILGNYQYTVPANLEYNKIAEASYTVKGTSSNTNVESEGKSTNIELKTGVGPKIETKLTANVGGNKITEKVKNGEVIQYKVVVSNTGSEDIENIKVKGTIPEGTKLVRGVDNYEYTGAYYYEEVENREIEETIESLKVGEVKTISYEVRVNNNTQEGTSINAKTEVLYGDAKKEDEVKDIKTEKGNLSVSVKRVTDRQGELYAGTVLQYYAIVENISNTKQENVKVQTNMPQNAKAGMIELVTGMGKYKVTNKAETEEQTGETVIDTEDIIANSENYSSEEIEYSNEINIGTLQPGEVKVLDYYIEVEKIEEKDKIMNFSVIAKNGKEEYRSNNWEEKIRDFEISVSMTSNTESQYVKSGDTIEYTIAVENKSDSEAKALNILDSIPEQLTITKILVNNEEVELLDENDMNLDLTTKGQSTDIVKVETVVNYSEDRDKAEAITNVAIAEVLGEKVATTSEVNHIIQAEDQTSEEENVINITEEQLNEIRNSQEKEEGISGEQTVQPSENGTKKEGDRIITGIAWFDENSNGQKDDGEKLLNGIKVRLLNVDTNNYEKEATTNENGIYVIDKIVEGKYIVIFDYDNTKYALTKYKASGVSDNQNSKAILNDLNINNETSKLASTDIIDVTNNNVSGINLGLIELKNFDLALNKYVNRILIQSSKGTTVKQYNNETIAKAEIDAKQVSGATVVIEYKIAVTNNGEIDGYAKKIADYVPSDLRFSSELNKDWYQVGNTLYTNSLANEKIKSGETKVVTLTLSKAMTENNTGLVANTAEIAESYNELGIEDGNSIPGNRVKDENDYGEAQVLLSIRTGGAVYITATTIVLIALIAAATVIIRRKKSEEGGE